METTEPQQAASAIPVRNLRQQGKNRLSKVNKDWQIKIHNNYEKSKKKNMWIIFPQWKS